MKVRVIVDKAPILIYSTLCDANDKLFNARGMLVGHRARLTYRHGEVVAVRGPGWRSWCHVFCMGLPLPFHLVDEIMDEATELLGPSADQGQVDLQRPRLTKAELAWMRAAVSENEKVHDKYGNRGPS